MTRWSAFGSRLMLWVGAVVLLVMGASLAGAGLLGVRTTLGRTSLCIGVALLVLGVAGVAGQLVERRIRRNPPTAHLADLDGRAALHLPRAPGPTIISSLALAGLGVAALLGAVFAGAAQAWGWCALLALLAWWALVSSAVRRGGSLAGGLWFTPAGMRYEDRGFRVDLPWDAVTGVVPQQPMPVLVRSDHAPAVTRTGPRGRAWRALTRDNTLLVDTRHLSGGAALASYIIVMSIQHPATRTVLGTEESLPPPDAYR